MDTSQPLSHLTLWLFLSLISTSLVHTLPETRPNSVILPESSVVSNVRSKRTLGLFGFGIPQVEQTAVLTCTNCVPLRQCSLGQDYTVEYYCHLGGNEPGICCPLDHTLIVEEPPPATTAPPPSVVSISVNTLGNEPEVEQEEEDEESPVALAKIGDHYICGYNGKKATRIHGGRVSGVKDWPWMAVLLRSDDFFHYCGGALITRRHVLTAAHCVYRSKKEDFLVRLGEYDFERINETRITDFKVKEIRAHEDFDSSNYQHDIAILVLEERANYGLHVQPLCLPRRGPHFENHTAIVAGWGTLFYGGPMSEVLMEVSVPIWPQKQCVASFSQPILKTVMCAGAHEGGRDSCQGDSGGPLMYQRVEDNRWMTIGVVSWGVRCGEKGKPGLYTRVNHYLNWIAARIRDV